MTARLARPDELPRCARIRHEVFVVGQGVPTTLEADGRDAACLHFVAEVDGEIVGTARLRRVGPEGAPLAKAERVAVLEAFQGRGLGRRLMEVFEAEAERRGFSAVVLHAQRSVVGFYERLGYEARGAPFFEADIEHVEMLKALPGR